MTGAGLKKCSPTTSAERPVAIAHSMTGRLDVEVASTAPGLTISSRVANSACLTERSSTTASTTRSASRRSSRRDDPAIRASASSRSSASALPRSTALSSERVTAARTRCTC